MKVTPAIWQRHGLWFALAAFAATRALIWIVACHAPQDRSRAHLHWSDVPTARWDAGHYHAILQNGYPPPLADGLPAPAHRDTVAFFPGYSLAARPLAHFMSVDAALVALTHGASFLAAVFLYLWARRRYDGRIAFWCVVLWSVYPPAMFFSTGYADGLLVFLVALALWLLEHERPWAAALTGAFATATRPTGLCLAAIIVLWTALHGRDLPWKRRQPADERPPAGPAARTVARAWAPWLLRLTAIGLISITGIIAFEVHLWHHYGRPDAFVAIQESWAQQMPPDRIVRLVTLSPVVPPAFKPIKYTARGLFHLARLDLPAAQDQFERLLVPANWNPLFNLTLVVAGIVGLLRPGRIPRVFYLLPILVCLEAYLPDPYMGGRMIGIARYQLIALPAFLLLANALARPRLAIVRYALCLGMLALQCIYVAIFVDWRMAG